MRHEGYDRPSLKLQRIKVFCFFFSKKKCWPSSSLSNKEKTMDEFNVLQAYPLARRGFVMTSLITGFTLATQRVEAQAIHTDAKGLVAHEVQIPVSDGHIPGYLARPEGVGPFPVVLVNEEIFGVHEYIKDVCRRMAHLGYCAVAPELYARIADLSKISEMSEIYKVINKKPDAQVLTDQDAAVAFAIADHGDASRVGVMGLCRGGRNTWFYAAHNGNVKAAVAFYGPLGGTPSDIQPQTALDIADKIHCPLLGLYGGSDPSIPVPLVHEAEAKAKAAGKTVEIVIYPDAPHGFAADYRPSYKEADAKDAWARMEAWFKKYLVDTAA
jgi:carboxymethylenebutenolidase